MELLVVVVIPTHFAKVHEFNRCDWICHFDLARVPPFHFYSPIPKVFLETFFLIEFCIFWSFFNT